MEEIFIPATGMAMEDAELVEWLKQPGEDIAADEPVALIETDKATTEVVATSGGVLSEHLHPVGARVAAGQAIAYVLAPGETSPLADGPAASEVANSAASQTEAAAPSPAAATARTPHTESPRQRRLHREAETAPVPVPVPDDRTAVVADRPASDRSERARERIARAVGESWTTIPHFAVSREIDVTDLLARLPDRRRSAPLVSMTDLLLRALARSWSIFRAEADPSIGISVATDRGVINVTVPGAATTELVELAARRRTAVDRGRRGQLTASDLMTSSVTFSNLGTHGVDWFTGIIPIEQLALVTAGRARRAVVVKDDGFCIRDVMWVTVNLDHRYLDGADGAKLLEMFVAECRELA